MFVGFSSAGTVAPSVTVMLHKITGGYNAAFVTAFIIVIVGLGLMVLYRVVDKKSYKIS